MSAAAADVFLSYSRTDAPAVRQIQAYLKQAGLATFLDRDQLPAGQPWLPALEQGIARCAAVAVLVGPAGLGTWQQREVQLALDRQAEAERVGRAFPVIPVLLPKVEDPPGGFLRLQTWVDLRSDLADPTQLHLLLTGIHGHAPADGNALREVLCPYRGLLPFREEDAGLFFGREDAIDILLGKVRDHSLVTLVGRSGSGKSSVVSAGLIPALRRRADGRTWSILSLRPGREPLHALLRLFDPPPVDLPPFAADQRVEQQVRILQTDDDALGRRIRSLLATPDEAGTDRLLLYVDQWEELYTQALRHSALEPEPVERDVVQFIDLLLAATRTSPCTVVLTVRADFYGEFLKHGPLAAAVPPGLVNLGPLRREGLKAAIEEPAKAVGLTVDPPLLEELVDEVCDDLGKLPLLEYALKETWRGREGQRLTFNAYGQAGGIDGAIARRANEIFDRLNEAEQAAARRLFVSLVTPGEGREDTRVRAVYPEQDDAIRAVVHAFSAADARLLVTGGDAPSARRLVEISHEAMIREWDRLKDWIKTNREALRRREHIRVRLRQWEEQGRDPTLLLPPGLPLEEGRKLLADHSDVLIEEVQPYIEASLAAERQRKEAQQSAQRKQLRRTRWAAIALSLLLLLAVAAFGFASQQRQQAAGRRAEAEHSLQVALVVGNMSANGLWVILLKLVEQTRKKEVAVGLQELVEISANGVWQILEEAQEIHEQLSPEALQQLSPEALQQLRLQALIQMAVVDVYQALGSLPKAQRRAEVANNILRSLVKINPGNAYWQSELSVSHEKIGEVLQAQGDLAGALREYQAALDIRQRGAQQDPDNAQWQSDLARIETKLNETRAAHLGG